jgi:ketosteroid isomerase-like protein
MDAAQVVNSFWAALEERDWDQAAAFLAPDVVVEQPDSGRVFHGREAFMTFNRDYPGDWHLAVVRTVAGGDDVAVEVSALNNGVREACLGFYTVRDGQIRQAKEWWMTPAG